MGAELPPWIFYLPDLYEFPEGSLPSPYGFMDPIRRLPPGLRLVAVGWLDGPIAFPTGPANPDVVAKLLGLRIEYLIDEGTRGFHTCYYCQSATDVENDSSYDDEIGSPHPWRGRPQSYLGKGHHLVWW